MKKLLISLTLLTVLAAPITERANMTLTWESEEVYPTRIYENGSLRRTFATNEIIFAGTVSTTKLWYVNLPAPKGGGNVLYFATHVDANGIESESSNTVTQYIRLSGPKYFRITEK